MADYSITSRDKYNNYMSNGGNKLEPGTNGLTGFKTWECYMLIKYR